MIRRLKELGLNETNTEVVIHGDHQVKAYECDTRGWLDPNIPRMMFMVMPFQKKQRVEKNITLYNIVPTLLDVMRIEHEPIRI